MSFCTINPVNKQAKTYNPMPEDHSYQETIFTFPKVKKENKGKNLLVIIACAFSISLYWLMSIQTSNILQCKTL